MQNLISNNGRIIDDNWRVLDTDVPFEPENMSNYDHTLWPLNIWLEHKDKIRIAPETIRIGVWINADETPDELQPFCNVIPVIGIHFPVFSDGRGYSSARILRQRLGYTGELRAFGDVLRDQLNFMVRCGFDTFAVRSDTDAQSAAAGLNDFSLSYQSVSANGHPLVLRH
jgi:uncharacterized protein (DUF934 family)